MHCLNQWRGWFKTLPSGGVIGSHPRSWLKEEWKAWGDINHKLDWFIVISIIRSEKPSTVYCRKIYPQVELRQAGNTRKPWICSDRLVLSDQLTLPADLSPAPRSNRRRIFDRKFPHAERCSTAMIFADVLLQNQLPRWVCSGRSHGKRSKTSRNASVPSVPGAMWFLGKPKVHGNKMHGHRGYSATRVVLPSKHPYEAHVSTMRNQTPATATASAGGRRAAGSWYRLRQRWPHPWWRGSNFPIAPRFPKAPAGLWW